MRDSTEKLGGSGLAVNRCLRFNRMIDQCGLIDLGYKGPTFTWQGTCRGGVRIKERLDRILANSEWRLTYPEAVVKHLRTSRTELRFEKFVGSITLTCYPPR
ncbi:serine-aspartate repeat-containing protein E [Striga asiatica]|uniref:Serine-aspartate repeat-containing protein E n=1 Tax=Striga asiatica TaxID=4170 RepID=A0A5A7Q1M0_STRAF|nr:serine-aspartate repeat-containing protein E [Striga asiatica]